jgi:hypothetical protein
MDENVLPLLFPPPPPPLLLLLLLLLLLAGWLQQGRCVLDLHPQLPHQSGDSHRRNHLRLAKVGSLQGRNLLLEPSVDGMGHL